MSNPIKTHECKIREGKVLEVRSFTLAQWLELPTPPRGSQHIAYDEDPITGEELFIELRNCPCGSTICVDTRQLK